jgi:hypothetical protein
MFTIEVRKKGKDEEFDFKDLEMFHQECYGGKIEAEDVELPGEYIPGIQRGGVVIEKGVTLPEFKVRLYCQRCKQGILIETERRIEIVKTAIDGKERKIEEGIRVIQKG